MPNRYLFALLLGFTARTILAQDTIPVSAPTVNHANLLYADLYRNHTPMSYLAPKGELLAPHNYVLSALVAPQFFVLANHASRVAVALSPEIMIRIRANSNPGDSSLPVRTPSYAIGAKVFWRLDERFRKYDDTLRFKYWEASFYHHSNGQDGSFYLPNGLVNRYNGNFSTNFVRLGFSWGQRGFPYADTSLAMKVSQLFKRGSIETIQQNRLYKNLFQLGVEWHPSFSIPALNKFTLLEHETGLNGQYGYLKLGFRFTHFILYRYNIVQHQKREQKRNKDNVAQIGELVRDLWRIDSRVNYILNPLDGFGAFAVRRRLNVEVAVHYTPRFMTQTALFVAGGYMGEDPYNIYFGDRYGYIRLGLSTGLLHYATRLRS